MTNQYKKFSFRVWGSVGLTIIALLLSFTTFASEGTIDDFQSIIGGKVTSKDGAGLPGVNVIVKGTQQNTMTDIDGNYSINISDSKAVLVFSFMGFKDVEVPVAGKNKIDVVMTESENSLNEVIVIGYGTQKKSDVIGSVSSVPQDRLKNLPVTNITQALQGTTAGVSVSQGSSVPGRTGSIQIRGLNSINASRDPFIVVDGQPFYGSYNDIPSADIKSIEILKDASATAIYGTRGSNGVILISTKRGNVGKPIISYSTYAAVDNIYNALTPGSAETYKQKYADYMSQRGLPQTTVLPNQNEIENYNKGITTDWLDEVTKSGLMYEHNLSVSGGTEKAKYFISANYLDQDGVIVGYQFHRATYRANFDIDVTDWLKLGTSSYFNNNNYDGGRVNLLMGTAMSPYSRPRDDNGKMIIYPMYGETLYTNPLLGLATDRVESQKNLTGNFYADVKLGFIDGLKFRINGSYTYSPYTYGYYEGREANNNSGSATINTKDTKNWTVENILTYTKEFGKHNVEALALYSQQKRTDFTTKLGGTSFVNDALSFYNIGAAQNVSAGSSGSQQTYLSVMGRLIYGYDSRYLMQFTIRKDGYSGFGANTDKEGVFPALGLKWNIQNEKFMSGFSKLNNLSLRVSYGATGNQAINPYQTLTTNGTALHPFNGTALVGTYINGMGNPNLNWETTKTANLALDFGFFHNRINGTIEAYKSDTSDLLMLRNIPSISGSSTIWDNIGNVENKGLEVTVNTVNIVSGKFRWETGLNFSIYRNKITELYGSGQDDVANKWFIGESLNVIYDYEREGIWQTSDIAAGLHLKQDPTARAGDIKFKDISGPNGIPDGQIDAQYDRKILGNSLPDWSGGITNRFTYGNFNLNIFFQTTQGVLKNNPDINYGDEAGRRSTPEVVGYWTAENQSNTWPSLIAYQNNKGYGFPKDASFIRLQDVRLSYTVPGTFLAKNGINNLVLYVSGRNLYTWTNWIGWDPENNQSYRGQGDSSAGLGDWVNNYPLVRTFSLGLNVSF